MKRLAVVGGGITGLSAARAALCAAGSGLEELKEYLFQFVAEARALEPPPADEEWPAE